MKKAILGLALAAMIISCKKETKVEETTVEPMGTETPAPEMDTMHQNMDTMKTTTTTTTTMDTSKMGGVQKTKVETTTKKK